MGEVIPFPSREPALCIDCRHGYLGEYGVLCKQFNEVIWNERVAEECPEFESRQGELVSLRKKEG